MVNNSVGHEINSLQGILLDNLKRNPGKTYLFSSLGNFTYAEVAAIVMQLADYLEPVKDKTLALNFKSQEQLFFFIWAAIVMEADIILLPGVTDAVYLQTIMAETQAEVLISDIPDGTLPVYPVPPLQMFLNTQYDRNSFAKEKVRDIASAVIKFLTSGTSGSAKVITVRHCDFNMVLQSVFSNGFLPHVFDKNVLITPPLFHSYGLSAMLEYSFAGSAVIFPRDSLFTGPVRELVNPALSDIITCIEGTSYFYLQFSQILHKTKFSRLNHIGFCGDAIDVRAIRQIDSYYPGLTYSIRYGMTETPSIVSGKTFSFPYDDWKSAGRVLPVYDIRIEDESGVICPVGYEGEIVIVGKDIDIGNDNLPERKTSVFKTGDIGYLADNDELYVLSRKAGVIKHKGYKINAAVIENLIRAMDTVEDCRVLLQENRLLAQVKMKGGIKVVPEKVKEFLRSNLPYYAIPDTVITVNEIPRTQTGKIKRGIF
jgi:acyl-coenzyme A synthetase/AMP-(fatty) acid ligase